MFRRRSGLSSLGRQPPERSAENLSAPRITLRDLCTRLALLWCDRAIRPRSETAPERAPLPPPTDAAQTRRRRRTQTAPVLFSADQPRRPIRHAHTDIQTGAGTRRDSGAHRRKLERLLGGAGTIGRDFLSDEARRPEIAYRISGLPSKHFQRLCCNRKLV